MKTRLLTIASFIVLSIPFTTKAQHGELDPSFGVNGISEMVIGQFAEELVSDMLLLPNGQILLASTQYVNSSFDFVVQRYNSDGTLDPSFAGAGSFVFDNDGFADHIKSIALQPDGKVILFGYSITTTGIKMTAVRISSNGFIDLGFGDNGLVSLSVSNYDTYGNDAVVQPNGKIILAGHTNQAGFLHFEIARLNTNGSLDGSFGSGGLVSTQNGESTGEYPSVELQSDGKIVVSGQGHVSGTGQQQFCVIRLNNDGSFDNGFSGDGVQLSSVDPSYTHQQPYGLTIQPDGRIVVVGTAGYFQNSSLTIMRFDTDGELDATFANGGMRIMSFTLGDHFLTDVLIQPDGMILTCGFTIDLDDNWDWILTRVDEDGNPDITFGTSTFVQTEMTGPSARALAIAMQPDGKILAAGYSIDNNTDHISAIARYESGVDVGVQEVNTSQMMSVYPNPSANLFHIKFRKQLENETMTLRNAFGQVMLSKNISATETNLDLSTYSEGIYFLSMEEVASPIKLVKQ